MEEAEAANRFGDGFRRDHLARVDLLTDTRFALPSEAMHPMDPLPLPTIFGLLGSGAADTFQIPILGSFPPRARDPLVNSKDKFICF
jgi:hypothetical protein